MPKVPNIHDYAYLEPLEDEDKKHSTSQIYLLTILKIGSNSLTPLSYILVWSIFCAFLWQYIEQIALTQEEENPLVDSSARDMINNFQEAKESIRVLGTFFSFALVFRFNICYNRWWEGRRLWGAMSVNLFDIAIRISSFIKDDTIANNFFRYLICYGYACKSLLRHESCADEENEDLEGMIQRGLLTTKEVDMVWNNPCWEPQFFIEIMRELIEKAYETEGCFGKLELNGTHKKLFKCFDDSFRNIALCQCGCIGIQSAKLPVAYDGIHFLTFYIYFTLAPMVWVTNMSWFVIPFNFIVAYIAISIIDLGTDLLDPFGEDIVDIPLEDFCRRIEKQVNIIKGRRDRGSLIAMTQNNTNTKSVIKGNMKGNLISFDSEENNTEKVPQNPKS